MDAILCAGSGSCRHNTVFIAKVLAESGFSPRVFATATKEQRNGHAWVQLMIDNEEYILDTNVLGRDFTLKTMSSAKRNSELDPSSFDAHNYTNNEKIEIEPEKPM